MMSMPRPCKDCRWAALEEWAAPEEKESDEMVWRCTHPRSKFVPLPDYVTGKPVKPRQLSCYEARWFDDGHTCAPPGRYWEAR
jgi:hypothetical protein